MAVSGAAAAAAASAPAWLPRVAFARDYRSSQRDVIISIFLRGAADGLTICPPHAEDAYYAARPLLAVPRPDSGDPNRAIDLDGFFGLAPTMAALVPGFLDGKLLIVHAAGSTDPSRSHFDAQRFMEVGKPNDSSIATGWLGRHLATIDPLDPTALLRGVGINTGLPRSLSGGPLTLPIPDLDNFGLGGSSATQADRVNMLETMYGLVPDPLRAAALNTLATIGMLDEIDFAGYLPAGNAVYPTSFFGKAMKSTAALIKAQVGVEAIAIDTNGWDTHNDQGNFVGAMSELMFDLSQGIGAFYADMTAGNAPTFTLVVQSEFGRRLDENASLGTDHGHGSIMILAGQCIDGGRVLTRWPGLAPDQLFEERDLDVTIDYRDVLAEIVAQRLGNPNLDQIFPGHTPRHEGVLAC